MALKKGQFMPPTYDANGNASYPDTVYLETAADMVKIKDAGNKFTSENVEGALEEVASELSAIATEVDTKADKLKVLTIEKDLNDYQKTLAQVNINQEAKQSGTGYVVVSLPKNAANGQVSTVVKGMTLKNELNYSRDTLAEWAVQGDCTKEGNLLVLKRISVVSILTIQTNLKPGTKYGFLLYVNNISGSIVDSSISFSVDSFNANDTGMACRNLFNSLGNKKLVIISLSNITDNRIRFRPINNDIEVKFKDIRVFELPIGSEIENDFNTMTADQLAQKYPYISGDSSKFTISAGRFKSVNVNLFDDKVYGQMTDGGVVDGREVYKLIHGITQFWSFKGKPNTQYTVSFEYKYVPGLGPTYFEFVYSDGTIDRGSDATPFSSQVWGSRITRSTLGKTVIGFKQLYSNTGTTYFDKNTFMLNEGNIALSYEPHKNSTQYFIAKDKTTGEILEARSLPNGTKDEVRLSESKRTINIKQKALQTTDIFTLITSYTNVDVVVILKPSDGIGYNNSLVNWLLLEGYSEFTGSLDNIINLNKFRTSVNTKQIELTVAKGSYVNLAQAQTVLAGTELTYQLATPIETHIEVSGILLSYPSGTVYFENAVADAGIYTNKFTILQQDLPIKELEKISKIDFMTGMETELDITKAVIAGDKKSFAHPNLENGDIVFLTYFYYKESTQGEMTVEYYDSRYVLKDSVTGKYYKVVPTVSNGILTNGLVEV